MTRQRWLITAGIIVVAGGFGYSVGDRQQERVADVGQAAERAAELTEQIHQSQIRACESSKQPGGIRYIVAQGIRAQMARAKRIDYHQLFPNIPAGQLHNLIQEQRADQFEEISQLLNVDCSKIYPKIVP